MYASLLKLWEEIIFSDEFWFVSLIYCMVSSQGQTLEMMSVVGTPLKSPMARSPLKSPAPDKALEEVKFAFKQCQEEFDRYRTEMKEQVR